MRRHRVRPTAPQAKTLARSRLIGSSSPRAKLLGSAAGLLIPDLANRGQKKGSPKRYNRCLFQPVGEHAASFTDDTSLVFAPLHVSIHAQIVREDHHSWFFYLRSLASNGQAEFKVQATRLFFELPMSERDKVFRSLRRARIHIADPRPYAIDLGEVLRKTLRQGTNIYGFLKRLDQSTQHLAAALAFSEGL
jgi:hypothetical protein